MINRAIEIFNNILVCKNNGHDASGICCQCKEAIVAFKKEAALLKNVESPGTDSQQLKVSIALLQRWVGVADDMGWYKSINPSLMGETNAVLAQQKTV
jgi:hypothetical protein